VPTLEEVEPIVPEMVLVEAGSFQMGSTGGAENEQPVHTVQITRPFYIGQYAVTFEEYDRFCDDQAGRRPQARGWGRGTHPVFGVTWAEVVKYCNWLSEKEGLTPCYSGKGKRIQCDFSANEYRLPTEAEWEYAARGGQKSQGYEYAGGDNPDDVAWYDSNSGGQPHPVGQKQPNELGLYDMSGNAFEWCWDLYGDDYYASSPSNDPTGPSSASEVPTPHTDFRSGCSVAVASRKIRIPFASLIAAPISSLGRSRAWASTGFAL
jgi:formylglycine-generating enzyme required for sulfatase activity